MIKAILKKDLIKDRWYSEHAGATLYCDKYDANLGYRVQGETVEDDVEFYVPLSIIQSITEVPDFISIGVEQLDPICKPERKGNWVDLKIAEEVIMGKGDFKYLSLGIKVDLPKGYEAYLLPRSSTFKRHGLLQANSMGVIDTEYSEEWKFPAYATRDVMIPKGTAIAQFRVVKSMESIRVLSIKMEDTGKTRGGLGSTDESKMEMSNEGS